MNTAAYLIKQLENLNITDIFGLAGDYNFNILREIENSENINWIGCTNELNAGYAADGYARVKGFGAVLTTYGVGELSAINAIAGSFSENVPVIHIAGTPDTKLTENKKVIHHGFQEPKPNAYSEAYKQVTQYSVVLNKDNAKIEIDKALKIFVKERKPVYIAIPSDIAVMEISDKNTDYEWYSDFDTLQTVTEKIAEKLDKASNPVILADILIKRFGAEIDFKEFVEESGIPAANFLMGSNIISNDSKNYLGTYFADYMNLEAKKAIDLSDCLISVGTIYGDVNSYGEKIPYDLNSHIAIYGTYTYIEGVKYDNVKMSDVLNRVTKKIHKRNETDINPYNGYKKVTPSSEKLSSKYIYPRLQEFLKENDIIVFDTGIISQGVFPIKFPQNIEILSQMLWCSIGWALPAAFGAGIAKPNKRIIILTGDGAHQVSAMELGNIYKHSQKPIIIVINNNGYTTERILYNDFESKVNDILQLDYTKFARCFNGDVWTAKVETEEDFDKALRVTQIMNKLCYIELHTDKDDMPELAKRVFGDIASNNDDEKFHNKTLDEISMKQNEHNEYQTLIHTSLKDYE